MFKKVVIANRGEIAVRIMRACKVLGISTVAVHSSIDRDSMHVKLADESVCIGGASPRSSYLNIPSIVAACEITGADAVHPGYGFLSENADFAKIVSEHQISLIGPEASHIELMGNKIRAKQIAEELGLPTTPGCSDKIEDIKRASSVADEIGYPVILKAAAGGGGRGMRVVNSKDELESALNDASSEAASAFGDGSVYIEKYLQGPRHVEVQIIGDGKGNVVHLGDRDCSLQRRHQKIIEEAPSPVVNEIQRDHITKVSVEAMSKLKYRSLGTLEFLFEDGNFYFIEMNTRLQVEHPITEEITGIDLVSEQIKTAYSSKIDFTQEEIKLRGHSIECRINAENSKTFAPSPGLITHFHQPGGFGVRVESGVYQGYCVPHNYDNMIAKLIVRGKDRIECLRRMKRALDESVIVGIDTNIELLKDVLCNEEYISSNYDVKWLEKYISVNN